MIFLFFGSSIAHLEPKLQRFENLSLFVGISATPGWVWLPAPSVAEIPTNIDKFSNCCNLGSRWAMEDPKKKENHQNLTLKMMITSNQVKLWKYSHTRALFLPQELLYARKLRFWPFSPKALSAKFFQQVILNRIVQGFSTMYDMPMIYFVWPKLCSPPLWLVYLFPCWLF